MKSKILGKSDLIVSRIGFKFISLKPDQKDNFDIVHAAMDKGINYFDTADLYDNDLNETLLGKAFAGKRDKVIIASKAGNQWRMEGIGIHVKNIFLNVLMKVSKEFKLITLLFFYCKETLLKMILIKK